MPVTWIWNTSIGLHYRKYSQNVYGNPAPLTISHNLGTKNVYVNGYDSKGLLCVPAFWVLDENTVEIASGPPGLIKVTIYV